MNSRRIIIHAMVVIGLVIVSFSTGLYVFAESDDEYLVAAYNVSVSLNGDGSADVMEQIDFTFFGGFNNIMIPIAKNQGEEIEITHVYMQRKGEIIECRQLMAGQWDAEVFTGTYGVIDEEDHVKLKIYGSFYRSAGTVFIHYRVKNALLRYRDVAEYRRMHIPDLWETRVSSINIAIRLPEPVTPRDVRYWLHGVFIGSKSFADSQVVRFDVPNTVPGEYVETRVVFPQSLVPDCPVTDDSPNLLRIMDEEMEYQNSDKSDLLKAREAAARKAGQRAFYERLKRRAGMFLSVLSVLLILAGSCYAISVRKKLNRYEKIPLSSDFRDIDRLDPVEARMLISGGKLGARAMFGKLMELAHMGFLGLGIRRDLEKRPRFVFEVIGGKNCGELPDTDRYLLDFIREIADSNREFDPIRLLGFADSHADAERLKSTYEQWARKAEEAYNCRDITDESIARYRNIGLLYGIALLLLGFIIPVAFTVAAGYALLPAGLLMLVFSLRMRKYTEYGARQLKIWEAVRDGIRKGSVTADELPSWMRPCAVAVGYGAALGVEKEAARLIAPRHEEFCEGCPLCALVKSENLDAKMLCRIAKNTLRIMDEAISSVNYAFSSTLEDPVDSGARTV